MNRIAHFLVTLSFGAIVGAALAVAFDYLAYSIPADVRGVRFVATVRATKGAFVALILNSRPPMPRSLPWALLFATFASTLLWVTTPIRGAYPEDALRWWNLTPAVLLAVILVARHHRGARYVSVMERA